MSEEEQKILRSQNVTLGWGTYSKFNSMVFTEHGIVMLASVLRSDIAVEVSVQIVRVFVEMKKLINQNKDLLLRIQEIEKHLGEHDDSIFQIMEYLKQFVKSKTEPRNRIGFKKDL